MKRVCLHWSGGSYACSDLDKEHYHYIVDGHAAVHKGKFTPEDNLKCVKGKYAAHTKGLNTGSIGVAICCMSGAIQGKESKTTKWPPTTWQVERFCRLVGELCEKYNIPVTPETVINHGDVERVLGVKQDGKWDICYLPWLTTTGENAGDWLRSRIKSYMRTGASQPSVPVVPEPDRKIEVKEGDSNGKTE